MNNKEKYIKFCSNNDFVPIYSQPWWLDAVCFDGYWDVLICEKDNQIIGALPFYVKKRIGISYITQPQLTQNNGVVIKYPKDQKYEKRLSYEKNVIFDLIEQLEKLPISFYQQNFHCSYTNWLPFYWKGYNQTTCYTYRLINILDEQIIYDNFDRSKKKNIKKANKEVEVFFDLPFDEFYNNHQMTLKKLGKKIFYDIKLFQKIYEQAYNNKQGRVIYCKDKDDNIHGALFIIWDKMSAYNLISTINPDFRNSGAASLLVYEAIKYVSSFVNIFDFEGSMIEGVENSFRKFGTIQTPYFHINKIMTKNPIIKFLINRKLK